MSGNEGGFPAALTGPQDVPDESDYPRSKRRGWATIPPAAVRQRYVVSGDICQVPHDYCPSCWGMWDFKDQDRECPSCGIVLGNEIKILLDTDICPHCENGKVSAANPECSKCGYKVDLDIVTWG